jgi:hypothetical protein
MLKLKAMYDEFIFRNRNHLQQPKPFIFCEKIPVPSDRKNNFAYTIGDSVFFSDGSVWNFSKIVPASVEPYTTGAVEPAIINKVPGDTVTDNKIIWKKLVNNYFISNGLIYFPFNRKIDLGYSFIARKIKSWSFDTKKKDILIKLKRLSDNKEIQPDLLNLSNFCANNYTDGTIFNSVNLDEQFRFGDVVYLDICVIKPDVSYFLYVSVHGYYIPQENLYLWQKDKDKKEKIYEPVGSKKSTNIKPKGK